MKHRYILSTCYAIVQQWHIVAYHRHFTIGYNNQASLHIFGMSYNVGYRRHVTIKLAFSCQLRFFISVLQDLNHLVTSDLQLMDSKMDSPKFYSQLPNEWYPFIQSSLSGRPRDGDYIISRRHVCELVAIGNMKMLLSKSDLLWEILI